MSDMLGGIFDSIRSVGDDIGAFFDTSLGQAVAKGAKSFLNSEDRTGGLRPSFRDNFIEAKYTAFNPERDLPYNESNDFYRTEREWLERLNTFRNMVQSTEVKK